MVDRKGDHLGVTSGKKEKIKNEHLKKFAAKKPGNLQIYPFSLALGGEGIFRSAL